MNVLARVRWDSTHPLLRSCWATRNGSTCNRPVDPDGFGLCPECAEAKRTVSC